ncbi:MAG: 16S rRNA (cytidine(1402)-2'-O)-methyltransferase [Clostridium sp.]|nr:16S rRNA (cytidine(1402)-2'-O)-methyltransferase [Clostridium sp.]MCM1443784.1 16S rRNA (cytidine(1402)-2'-O)-methyltransferase [Candidatus Amulumruptor caecigallinarius]
MSQKSYDKTPTLYLIPTPIGNMEDITLRAIKILNQVEVIFSEDTRVTSALLSYHGIKKKLFANHKFNEEENQSKLLDYLSKGYDVGLVSDRGTPIISDPGFGLAICAIQNGYNVVGLPGATAFVPAIITSGLSPMPFLFYGFLNNKESKRKSELQNLKYIPYTIIFYEAPHRIQKTLLNIREVFGNRKISISREISKKFEEIYRSNIDEVVKEMENVKGELVIVVSGNKENDNYENLTITEHVNIIMSLGFSLMDSIKRVAKERGITKNDVYNEYHGIKK